MQLDKTLHISFWGRRIFYKLNSFLELNLLLSYSPLSAFIASLSASPATTSCCSWIEPDLIPAPPQGSYRNPGVQYEVPRIERPIWCRRWFYLHFTPYRHRYIQYGVLAAGWTRKIILVHYVACHINYFRCIQHIKVVYSPKSPVASSFVVCAAVVLFSSCSMCCCFSCQMKWYKQKYSLACFEKALTWSLVALLLKCIF